MICFLINTLENGGAERVVSILASNFHQQQYPVTIICLNRAQSGYQLPQGLKVIYLADRKGTNVILRGYYVLLTFIKLIHVLVVKRPRCVISFMTTANLWAGLSCMLTQTQYIVSERTTPEHTINTYGTFLRWFSLLVYSNAKAIVVPSAGIENCLRKNRGFKSLKNYKVIKNPVTNPGIVTAEKVNDRKFILGVGRLSYEKGFDQLIEAYKKSDAKDTDLLIAGDGIERNSLKEQIASLKLQKRVKLIGVKDNLQDYYSQAELFVLPSRNEGYPNALIEAMSMGCSCIAMNCQFGPAEIIDHQRNGLLVEDKNITKLSSAISEILGNPELRQQLGLNARLINMTNSLEIILSQWKELIFRN